MRIVDAMPDVAVESFAGVANPFSLGALAPGDKVARLFSVYGYPFFARKPG